MAAISLEGGTVSQSTATACALFAHLKSHQLRMTLLYLDVLQAIALSKIQFS